MAVTTGFISAIERTADPAFPPSSSCLLCLDPSSPLHSHRPQTDWQLHYPPSSVPTDITLSQFLTIQEKGVSAWCFEPDYESNPSLYVQSRTEITFLADGPGMPVEEGGGNSVMANLPLPKLNEVYYFECKMYEKPDGTDVAIGLATKPFPSFRLPGELSFFCIRSEQAVQTSGVGWRSEAGTR